MKLRVGISSRGFTIVELLIVIVVIAILAAITMVSYNGITGRAKDASVQSDVETAVKKLEVYKYQTGTEQYPASLGVAGVTASSGNTFDYQMSTYDNSYCVRSSNGGIVYSASSTDPTVKKGECGDTNRIGWWPMNGTANDQSGNGYIATTSGVSLTTGQNGQTNGAYVFSGAGDAVIDTGASSQFNSPELTMSAWINMSDISGTNSIMAREGSYKFRMDGNGTTFSVLASSNAAGWTLNRSCTFNQAVGQWYNAVLVISSAKNIAQLYANGALVCAVSGISITAYAPSDLLIGNYKTTATTEVLKGTVDDARFYNRALSAAEVGNLYQRGAQ